MAAKLKRKLLLTGISGFLGWNIHRNAKEKWEVSGTVYSHRIDLPGVRFFQGDLTNYHELKRIFCQTQPDAVVHTAAITDANFCQKCRSESFKINVEASNNLAGLCADRGIPCVFTSTDLVFNGLNPPYREEDSVSPVSFYGEQKAQAEVGMRERHSDVIICRMPLMFGDPGPVAQSFIQPMIKALQAGEELKLFTDEFRTPVGGISAAEGILLALDHAKGIIHLGGRERVSRYEFGKLLTDITDFPNAKLIPCRQIDVPMSAPRPPDVSLDSSKAYTLGYHPLSIEAELRLLDNPKF